MPESSSEIDCRLEKLHECDWRRDAIFSFKLLLSPEKEVLFYSCKQVASTRKIWHQSSSVDVDKAFRLNAVYDTSWELRARTLLLIVFRSPVDISILVGAAIKPDDLLSHVTVEVELQHVVGSDGYRFVERDLQLLLIHYQLIALDGIIWVN